MPSLKDIKKRIGSLKNTSQITKAMKMVSAAKLRKAQESILAARPYAGKMQEVLGNLASRVDSSSSPLLEVRELKKVEIILFSSDRGLCGAFNASLIKEAEKFISEAPGGKEVIMSFAGRRGAEYFKRRGRTQRARYDTPKGADVYSAAAEIGSDVIAAYSNGSCDEVYMLYGTFKSALTQVPTLERLLPIEPKMTTVEEVTEFLFEPSAEKILEELLPKYVSSQIFKALLETAASEHGARMTAMDSASKNASDMIGRLTLQYNRARQATITKELLDIINGAEAL